MNAVFNFIKKNAVLLVAIIFAIASSVSVVSAKYVYKSTVADDLKLTITKDSIEYVIDKAKMHTALKAITPKPTALKFVKGNEVPADATRMDADGIQGEASGNIGVYQSVDTKTIYIAPEDNPTAVIYAPTDCSHFLDLSAQYLNMTRIVETIDLHNLDTSRTEDMNYMFCSVYKPTSLDLSGLNTANVRNMECMFYYCFYMTSLDLSSFNTANVQNMSYMFYYCWNLKTITVSNGFVTDSVTNGLLTFYFCYKLVGGAGTTCVYNDVNTTSTAYAKIDGGPSSPGYFTGNQ